ncbi:FAD-dependent oxidoreductase [Winogradskya consettensis]|uniref:6-hydroxy-D-nicotine oxidase n=1 Tax=Winogradskya consettensis TaxID=113560 RepID=A0A919SAH1_9ACTN|nr:FAD-binding oxidoreductase [Actinoplanes consettensis]GIM68107.1 6-hydroxy-D-nicotine oxidase [Actinoplanes consettensis]
MVPPPDVSALKAHLRPEQILTSATEFEALITPWNGAITHRPAVVVRCETVTDVQAVVAFAGSQGIPLSVRGRGHDWAGRALRDGGITIDLAALNSVRVDPVTRQAVVGGGTSIGELLSATGEHGLVAVTGTVASVGVVGLATGGGYGPLSGRYGLAADNLTGADVVLADGSLVTADDDLLWALRGGGGNFGVVVSARFDVHRVPSIVAGTVMYPLTQAAQVLSRLRETEFPDELYVLSAFLSGPDGTPLLLVSATWCGDAATGLAEDGPVHALARLGTPVMAEVAEQSLAGSAAAMSAGFPYGRHVDLRTRSVPEVSDEIVDVLTEHFARVPSPLSTVALHAFGGAAARVAPDATAFGLRTPHRLIEMISLWPDASRSAENRRWTADLDEALRPFALPGGYANLLGPGATDQIPFSFGANATRLRSIKEKYDPRGVFTAIPLP